jgi:NTP pyrophosphatase (non-canonical NTP hydrolase)
MTTQISDTFWADYITEAMSFAVLQLKDLRAEHEANFGLIEEVGEVAGVFKRVARGDNGGGLDCDKLAKELGDLLWYVTRCAIVCEWMMPQEVARLFAEHESANEDIGRMTNLMVVYCLGRLQVERTGSRTRKLFRIAEHAGLDMREVATKNLEKLRARRIAGTIQGSGDNR